MSRILFGLCFFVLTLPAQGASSANGPAPTMTRIFVHAWMPEFGSIGLSPDSAEQRLFDVAALVRQGEFKMGEGKLEQIEADAKNVRTLFLVNLFRQELWRRRFLLLSGGRKAVGESRLDEMRFQTAIDDLTARTNSLLGQMPALEATDARIALSYAQVISLCLFESVGLRRLGKLNEENRGPSMQPNNSAWGTNRRDLVEPLDTLGLDSFLYDVLGRTQHDLLRHDIEGQLAAADFDFASAKRSFQAGLEQALKEGQTRSAAEFMLRLGDLNAAPYGDVLTFGYNLISENVVRQLLRSKLPTQVITTPPISALEAAERYYRQAAEMTANDRPETYRITIRYAHLARLRRDFVKATRLYEQTALEAKAAGASRYDVVATASAALLTGSREPLMAALRTLVKRGDIGTALSLLELSHSWASRLWYFDRDLRGAVSRLLIITDASTQTDVGLDREAVDPLQTLAALYQETGRLEASIQVMQQAVAAQDQYLARAEPASAEFRVSHPSDRVMLIANEKSRQMANLSQLALAVSGLLWQEGSANWKNILDDVQRRIKVLSQDPVLNTPETKSLNETTETLFERNLRETETLFKTQSILANTITCKGLREHYDQLRTQLVGLAAPIAAWRLDAQVSRCAPEHMQIAQAELRRAQPIVKLKRVLEERSATPSFTTRTETWAAIGELEMYFEAALTLKTYDVLLTWTDELKRLLAAQDSSWQYLRPATETYRAAAMLGLGQFDAARNSIVALMKDEASWALRPPQSRIAVLDILVHLEAQQGNAQAGLIALEKLRFEQERLNALRSGVETDVRQSAELATLERIAATMGNLPAPATERLRELRSQVEQASATVSEDLRPPTLENLTASLKSLPERTNLIVYHLSPRGITVWRASRTQALTVTTLQASPLEVIELARGLELDLVNDYPDWEKKSAKLYDALIKPLGMLQTGETLIFAVQGALATIPFEVLGPTVQTQLLRDHPIAYATRLVRKRNLQVASTAGPNAKALVVGLSDEDIPNAEIEASQIAALLKVKPLLGNKDATAERVRAALKEARFVHFATHGTMERINPYLSWLSLANNERVEAWQLFRDAPSAEMIVLSACDTRREARETGMTGETTSLNSFAFAGGARWVVASLWSADDDSSSAIMLEFYRLLIDEHLDQVQALQRAKLKIADLKPSRPFRFAHFLLSASDLSAFNKSAH